MSPGRQRWGFSGCDGSTLKNTSVPFPPACALVSVSLSLLPSSIFYLLRPVSSFLYPLLSLCSSPSLPPLFFSLGRTRTNIFCVGKVKRWFDFIKPSSVQGGVLYIVFMSFPLVGMF